MTCAFRESPVDFRKPGESEIEIANIRFLHEEKLSNYSLCIFMSKVEPYGKLIQQEKVKENISVCNSRKFYRYLGFRLPWADFPETKAITAFLHRLL